MRYTRFNSYKTIVLCISILTFICIHFGCERDDICGAETQTTPFLVIKFLDDDARTEIKAPVDLSVKAVGDDIATVFSLTEGVRDSITIPLRTQENITQYELTINSTAVDGDPTMPNTDILTIQYATEQVYVSSACGFKINYDDLSQTLVNDGDKWIKGVSVQRANITDETEAHLFIFH